MIKIGTRCVMIPDGKKPQLKQSFVGVECTLISYDLPDAITEMFPEMDCEVRVDDIPAPLCTRHTNLIPLGDDPDAETREVKKELTA